MQAIHFLWELLGTYYNIIINQLTLIIACTYLHTSYKEIVHLCLPDYLLVYDVHSTEIQGVNA